MGKPNHHDTSFTDAVSLHSNLGEPSAATAPYTDDDAPEIDIDDLPPNYSDALESSEAVPILAPILAPSSAVNDTIRPHDIDAKVVVDTNSGAQTWVAKSVEDPASLETYIRQLSGIPPRPYMKLVGTHTETTRDSKGKHEKNTVTDFDVMVELTPYLFADAQYRRSWSQLRTVHDAEAVHRGTIRARRGEGSNQSIEIGSDAKPTLQEWCHRYAASPARLKRFTFRRRLLGFDEEGVRHRLEELVRRTNYRGHLQVQLVMKDAHVDFYNDAKINRWRLTPWIQWLFILTLTIIFSWPYLLLRTKRWEVVVADWLFSRANAVTGNKEYVSISEDQWYNMWAQAICRAVLEKRQTVLDQSDLRRAHEAGPAFDTGNTSVDNALGLFRASIHAMNEVNRQLGWGGDC
ncbi:putative ABC transporter protein [Rosellinia necatrix]|uniref:Putative ABC transporter protein n=1 Tax=Rosellinia necatrix TaxID=77044 RepID=A0A1W2TR57_ROSNE|nr:putative ABC transporter protein [Rosellinia necatrix]